MSMDISLDELIALIREHQGIPPKMAITEASLLEKDLGITGDDGCELIEVVEKKFGISFAGATGSLREAVELSEGQYLFHSEGMNLFGLIASLFGHPPENVRAITVGELYLAVCRAKENRCIA